MSAEKGRFPDKGVILLCCVYLRRRRPDGALLITFVRKLPLAHRQRYYRHTSDTAMSCFG